MMCQIITMNKKIQLVLFSIIIEIASSCAYKPLTVPTSGAAVQGGIEYVGVSVSEARKHTDLAVETIANGQQKVRRIHDKIEVIRKYW